MDADRYVGEGGGKGKKIKEGVRGRGKRQQSGVRMGVVSLFSDRLFLGRKGRRVHGIKWGGTAEKEDALGERGSLAGGVCFVGKPG